MSAREPRTRTLHVAAVLGAVNLAWALFLWWELIDLRAGGEVFCAFADTCASAWTSPEAKWVEGTTGLPIAGWGAAWSAAALALPLLSSMRHDNDRSAEPFWSATVSVALGGLLGVLGLVSLSVLLGLFCPSCAITYVGVVAYGIVTIREALSRAPVSMPRGLGTAAIAFAAAFGLASIPAYALRPADFDLAAAAAPAPPAGGDASPVASFLREVPVPVLQQISNEIHFDRLSGPSRVPIRSPRGLDGSPDAPVRLTEFVDLLCSHCAEFHETLEIIRRRIGPSQLAVETRYFPLDGNCNKAIQKKAPTDVRCTAAKALICSAGKPFDFELAGKLFAAQRALTSEGVYEIAGAYTPRAELERCVADPTTEAALAEDIDWALEHQIRGTPLVLLNGRPTFTRNASLFALLLADGDLDDPAFAALPPPRTGPSPDGRAQ